MRRVIKRTLISIAIATTAGCTLSGPGVSPYGRLTTINPSERRKTSAGELIAVSSDSVWLLGRDSLFTFGMGGISSIEVQRHQFNAKRTFIHSLVVGVAAGAALGYACSTVEDTDGCGAVFPVIAGFFTAGGAVLAIGTEQSSKFYFAPYQWSDIRAYARFPQGMPDSARATLVFARPSGVLRR
jgi:hypothetical protein